MAAEKHPHLGGASDAQLEELLAEKPEALRRLYLEAHRWVLATLPGVAHATDLKDLMTGYGVRQYGYGGWGLGALAVHAKWVSLVLFRGADLADPDGLLEGTGKSVRHVKLRSLEQLEQRRDGLQALLRQASTIQQG